jgi:hypothetical protein
MESCTAQPSGSAERAPEQGCSRRVMALWSWALPMLLLEASLAQIQA